MQALFEAVRQACSSGEWSRGVELSRGGGVVVEHATNDEVMLKISGVKHWLWRAVDQTGIVLDVLVQRRRDTPAAQRMLPSGCCASC